MLRNTFIHLPGIGSATERNLWRMGVSSWNEFHEAENVPARVERRFSELKTLVRESETRFDDSDAAYFNRCLPPRERWRLYGDFRDDVAFLDIETTGLSAEHGYITMVGILDNSGYHAFVQGENLEELREALEYYRLVVTFNGASFDLPFIEHHFGNVFRDIAHIDLRFPLKRLGHKGGLKSIERNLGLARPSALSALDGYDAVLLWQMWMDGDKGARDTLVSYNAEDVLSLPLISDMMYSKLSETLPHRTRPLPPFPKHEPDLPYDLDSVMRVKQTRRDWEQARALRHAREDEAI